MEPIASEEEISKRADMRIKDSLKETGSLKIVTGRGVRTGDVVVMDFELRRKDTDEVIEGSQQLGRQFDTASMVESVQLPGMIACPKILGHSLQRLHILKKMLGSVALRDRH